MRKFFKLDRENGNSFIMYILLLPVLMGFFGYAVDSGISYYTRTGMQNALDSAAIAGATKVNYNGAGNFVIDAERAKAQAIASMKVSMKQYPNVECSSGSCYNNIKATIVSGGSGRGSVLRLTVQQKSKTLFLHIIGIKEQPYNLKSEARIGYVQQ
jgi:Flp pilus assembly protein TadG